MSDRITRADVHRLAETCGVHVATWSPGDGVTRYRFIAIDGNHTSLDYFGASGSDVLGTCLGTKESYAWLQGFRACHIQAGWLRIREARNASPRVLGSPRGRS